MRWSAKLDYIDDMWMPAWWWRCGVLRITEYDPPPTDQLGYGGFVKLPVLASSRRLIFDWTSEGLSVIQKVIRNGAHDYFGLFQLLIVCDCARQIGHGMTAYRKLWALTHVKQLPASVFSVRAAAPGRNSLHMDSLRCTGHKHYLIHWDMSEYM